MVLPTCVFLIIILIAIILLIRSLRNHGSARFFERTEDHEQDWQASTNKPIAVSAEEMKGRRGEQTLFSFIARTESAGARILRNCWLRFGNGTVTESDLILIYRSGIYVIESKNYNSCWIFGSAEDAYWTRTWLNKKDYEKKSRKFYNPLEQNRVHTNCISDLVSDIDVPIYSIVAFSDKCELKKVPVKTTYSAVINYRDLKTTIAEFLKSQPKRISNDDVDRIYNRLAVCSAGVSEEEKIHHDNLIKEMQ